MDDLAHRFNYHPPSNDKIVKAHEEVRRALLLTANVIDQLVVDGREKSLAITKLEEAMMWANAGIARTQSTRKASS